MKKVFIIILAMAALASCSGNKEVAKHAPEFESSTNRVVSYGPKGKIILDNPAESSQKTHVEETVVVDEDVLQANSNQIAESQSVVREKVNKVDEGKKKERTSKYIKVARKISRPNWEPYIDKNAPADPSKNGFAIAGFVMSFFWFLSPIALVLSIVGMKSEKRGLAIAGIILSGLTLLVFLAILIAFLTGYF